MSPWLIAETPNLILYNGVYTECAFLEFHEYFRMWGPDQDAPMST